MYARMAEQITSARITSVPAVVLDAAVLLEAGWDDLCTDTVWIDAPAPNRQNRVRSSRGWDDQTLRQRESAQIPLDRKANRCSYRVRNDSSVSHLREQVRQLLHQITHR